MTLVQSLRVAGGHYAKPNIYDDAADRINELEAALLGLAKLEAENKKLREQLAAELVYGPDRTDDSAAYISELRAHVNYCREWHTADIEQQKILRATAETQGEQK